MYRVIFENAISSLFLSSTCTLSADPQLLCIFSLLLLLLALLLVATPRNWLNASVVRFTRTFSEPIRRKPRSFSACSINHRVTTRCNHRSWRTLDARIGTFLVAFNSVSKSRFLSHDCASVVLLATEAMTVCIFRTGCSLERPSCLKIGSCRMHLPKGARFEFRDDRRAEAIFL